MSFNLQKVRALVVEIEKLRHQLAKQQVISREKTMAIDSIEGIFIHCLFKLTVLNLSAHNELLKLYEVICMLLFLEKRQKKERDVLNLTSLLERKEGTYIKTIITKCPLKLM